MARTTAGQHGRATDREVIEVILALSNVHRAFTIAATLNRLGSRTGTGKTWRAHSVACVRYHYRLPNFAKGYDWLTLSQAAQQLGVSATVVKRCSAHGTLPARQGVPQASWIIQRTDLALPAVQAAVQGGPRVVVRPACALAPPPCRQEPRLPQQCPWSRAAPSWGQECRDAAVRLSRLQTRSVRWLAAEERRTRGRITRSHPELVAARPSAKGNISHSLRRLETQGLIVMTRTPGENASVSLTAAGRQKALKLTGRDA